MIFKRVKNPFEEEHAVPDFDNPEMAGETKTSPSGFSVKPFVPKEETESFSRETEYFAGQEEAYEQRQIAGLSQALVSDDLTERREDVVSDLRSDRPETTVGEGVCIKGELEFERFLQIDGIFEGTLVSQGKLKVGPAGVVRSTIENLSEATVEGVIEGDVSVTGLLELRGRAKIYGNIKAGSLSVDDGVTIEGKVSVAPTMSFDEEYE